MRILLVRLRLIGDVVLTTPALRALRLRYPDAHIAYLVEPTAAPIILRNEHVNDVIVAADPHAPRRFWQDVSLARALGRGRFDLAIDLHGGPRSGWLTWASGAPIRIGYEVMGRRWMYTTSVPRPRGFRPRHSVENQWDLLAPLGIPPPDRAANPTEMSEDPDAASRVENWLARANVADHPLIVVHAGAGNRFRRWLPERFADVIVALAEADPERRFLIVAGPEDPTGQLVRDLATRRLAEPLRAALLDAPSWTLPELHAIFRRAALYVGCDTGPLHVAGTTNVPIVGLYGPTLPVTWAPWRPPDRITETIGVEGLPCRPCDQRVCVPGDFRCLTTIDPREVIDAAERALAGRGVGL